MLSSNQTVTQKYYVIRALRKALFRCDDLIIKTVLLTLAVTLDGLAAAVSLGCGGVFIPKRSAFILAAVGAAFLGVSALCGNLLLSFIPAAVCNIICAVLLTILGLYEIFKSRLKNVLEPKMKKDNPNVIFLDEMKSDTDHNNIISARESVALSIALSADSLLTGAVSAGVEAMSFPILLRCVFAAGFLFIYAGNAFARRFCRLVPFDLSILCGVMLIILGWGTLI
jgi:putative sporulation protein YtaF